MLRLPAVFRKHSSKRKRRLITAIQIICIIVVIYSIFGWILYYFQPRFVYHPLPDVTYNPKDIGIEYEDVYFQAQDGIELNGWFVPGDSNMPTVLFCHGNAGNITHRLDTIKIFYELGLNCFIFDYRGYGNSKGSPDEEGTYLDAYAAYLWLTDNKHIEPKRIILFGRSLGGSIAADLASKVSAGSLVVESAFTSFVAVGKKYYPFMPVKLFARFDYNTIGHIKKVKAPVMVIHSPDDRIISFKFGKQLFEAANEPKKFVEIAGGHNDGFLLSKDIYVEAWKQWVLSMEKIDL